MGEDPIDLILVAVIDDRRWSVILPMQGVLLVGPEQTNMKFIVCLAAWWQCQGVNIWTGMSYYLIRASERCSKFSRANVFYYLNMFCIK